jgi:hypothetical protein
MSLLIFAKLSARECAWTQNSDTSRRSLPSVNFAHRVGGQLIWPVFQEPLLLVVFSLCGMFKKVRHRSLVFPAI